MRTPGVIHTPSPSSSGRKTLVPGSGGSKPPGPSAKPAGPGTGAATPLGSVVVNLNQHSTILNIVVPRVGGVLDLGDNKGEAFTG